MAYMPKMGLEEVSITNGVTPVLVEELWVDLAAPDPGTQATGDLRFLNVTGDAMAGPLTVLAPAQDTEATNKAYVDDGDAAVAEYSDMQNQGVIDYADEIVTVSTSDPVEPPSRDGLLWIKVEE